MKKNVYISIVLSITLVSCFTYTAGYQTMGAHYFIDYSNDTSYYYNAMNSFGNDYPELMIDSSLVFQLYRNHYFSLPEKKQIYDSNRKYPLYPLKDWAGLYTWSIKSSKYNLIYEIGLFNCGFENPKQNNCMISLYSIYATNNDSLKGFFSYQLKDNNGRKIKKELISKFESEIIPLMEPYFKAKSK